MRDTELSLKKRVRELARRNYTFLVRESDGEFEITFPQLRGCRTSGKSLEEALGNMEEAKAAWIGAILLSGRSVPDPVDSVDFSGRFIVRCGKSLHRALSEMAALEGVSLNQFIVQALSERVGGQMAVSTYRHEAKTLMGWLQKKFSSCFWSESDFEGPKGVPLRAPDNKFKQVA